MRSEEILAFESGVKPGIARPGSCEWARSNFRKYHGVLDTQLGYVLFHSEDDLRDYRMNGVYAEDFGRLMGYPPIAYENWTELCESGWDVKQIVDYSGIRFVCFNHHVEQAIAWMDQRNKVERRVNA